MATASFNLADLDGSNGLVINGINEEDFSGSSVSGAGDINGDGIDDIIIRAPFAESNGLNDRGESYVVFGSTSNFSSSLKLSELDGSNGFVINGVSALDFRGSLLDSVSSAGDINGDGIDDIVIGVPYTAPNDKYAAGESYVLFGSQNEFNSSLELSALDGTNGFVIEGNNPGDNSGSSVSGAGDVNGDGIDDIIIGAPRANYYGLSYYIGASYVVFGDRSKFNSSLDLSTLDGSNGFTIDGIDFGEAFGNAVSGAGDVNGDGLDDIIINAPFAASGESYVIFGSQNGFDPNLNLSALDGSNGFTIFESQSNSAARGIKTVSSAGDFNGDGIDDLIIGKPGADTNGVQATGKSYVVFGDKSGFNSRLDLSTLDGSNGFAINGIDLYDLSGYSVNGAGDFNGDGFDDIIIGAPDADPTSFDNPSSGYSVGQSYIVFGGQDSFDSIINLSELDGSNGFVINGANPSDQLGRSVSGAGDFNGDGIDDVIIGTPGADANGNFNGGVSYLLFGFKLIDGTSDDDRLVGTISNDNFTGGGGNDTFIITAGDGTDTITDFGGVGRGINPSQNVIDEIDTVRFSGEGLTAENLLLTQNQNDLELTFEGVANTKLILSDFNLEQLDNIPSGLGNILFDGQQEIQDSFDVFNAEQVRSRVFNRNTVTFLNDVDNTTQGFDNSDDVINAQGGNDILLGRSGNDILRGGDGNDPLLDGGAGDDLIDGGAGRDGLFGGAGNDQFVLRAGQGTDTIFDFDSNSDKLLLDGLPFEELTIVQNNSDTTISIADTSETLASLIGVVASQITADNFMTIG